MSRILNEMHETAQGLHDAGVFSENLMEEFDTLCLPKMPEYLPQAIKAIRTRYRLNQKEMARLLNVSASTIQKWETGMKKPRGAARKLLDVLEKKGISALV